jgi:hypothetical protein
MAKVSHCLLIAPNGAHEFRDIASADDIKAAVGGDFDWSAPSALMFYCYQYALYERAINPVATELYHFADANAKARGDLLAGDVLVSGPPVDDDETDIPEQYVQVFYKIRRTMGRALIDELAVPLPPERVTQMKAEEDQRWALIRDKLAEGNAVDVGGLIIGRADNPEERT